MLLYMEHVKLVFLFYSCLSIPCIKDILPWMAVERLLESFLVKRVTNETNAPGQDEKAIKVANFNDLNNFLLCEHSTAG